jgi:hypothetical protein
MMTDGWYRMTGSDVQDWTPVSDADAEAEIAAGGGRDLMSLGFGVAEPMDPDEHRRCLEGIHRRLAEDLPDGYRFVPLEVERD